MGTVLLRRLNELKCERSAQAVRQQNPADKRARLVETAESVSPYKPEDFDLFDPRKSFVHDKSITVLVGPRKSGKTTLLVNLLGVLNKYRCFGLVFAVCGSRGSYESMCAVMPSCLVQLCSEAKEIINALQRIDLAVRWLIEQLPVSQRSKFSVVLALDDIAFDKKIFLHRIIAYLVMNGRHDGWIVFLGLQYFVDFPRRYRANVNYFFGMASRPNEIESLRKFFSFKMREHEFLDFYNQMTENRNAFVWTDRISRNMRDYVFRYRANIADNRFSVWMPYVWQLQFARSIEALSAFHSLSDKIDKGEIELPSELKSLAEEEGTPSQTSGAAQNRNRKQEDQDEDAAERKE